MSNWKQIGLGDTATFFNGYAFKPTDWSASGKEIIRIQNLTKGSSQINYFEGEIPEKYKVRKGDILISWSGSLGVYEWKGKDSWLNQHLFKVVFDKEDLDKSFFTYLISNSLKKLETQVHGATMKHITKKKFDTFPVALPPIDQQKKIAAILDAADAYRRKTKALIEKYDELTQSLFLDMFGDISFDLKYAKGKVDDLVIIVRDGPHVSPKYSESGFPILSTRNIRPFQLVMDDVKYVSEEMFGKLTRKFKPQKGDILLTKGGTTGYAKVVDWDWDFCIWVHIAALRVNKEKAHPKYLEAALNSHYGYQQAQRYTRGIANKDLGLKRMIKIELPIPPLEIQNQFADSVQAIEAQKAQAQASLAQAEGLFNSLLQRAFKGELS